MIAKDTHARETADIKDKEFKVTMARKQISYEGIKREVAEDNANMMQKLINS